MLSCTRMKVLTTLNSNHCKNISFVIEPSTTLHATIPSRVSKASVDVRLPRLNASFFAALQPLFDLPKPLASVLSSLDVSSRKPRYSGGYCNMRWTYSALPSSSLSIAIFWSFLHKTPDLAIHLGNSPDFAQ
jgi:hypothetical protein